MKLEDAQISSRYNADADILMITLVPLSVETTVHYCNIEPGAALLLDEDGEIVGFQIEGWRKRVSVQLKQIHKDRNKWRDTYYSVLPENEELREDIGRLREENDKLREALRVLLDG